MIKKWLKTHPSLSISSIEREAGVPIKTLAHYLNGTRNIPSKHKDLIIDVLKRYGYNPNSYYEPGHQGPKNKG